MQMFEVCVFRTRKRNIRAIEAFEMLPSGRGANDGRRQKHEEAADTRAKALAVTPARAAASPPRPHRRRVGYWHGIAPNHSRHTSSQSRARSAQASFHDGTCSCTTAIRVLSANVSSLNLSVHTSNAYARRSQLPFPSPTSRLKHQKDTMFPKLKRLARPKCSSTPLPYRETRTRRS